MEMKWYMVYTKPEAEKKVLDQLARKHLEFYFPISKSAPGKRIIQQPLLKSTVFVRTSEQSLAGLKNVPGIHNMVYRLDKPVTVPDSEIEHIKQFLKDRINLNIEKVHLTTAEALSVTKQQNLDVASNQYSNMESLRLTLPSLGLVLYAEYRAPAIQINATESFREKIRPSSYRYFLSECLAGG